MYIKDLLRGGRGTKCNECHIPDAKIARKDAEINKVKIENQKLKKSRDEICKRINLAIEYGSREVLVTVGTLGADIFKLPEYKEFELKKLLKDKGYKIEETSVSENFWIKW